MFIYNGHFKIDTLYQHVHLVRTSQDQSQICFYRGENIPQFSQPLKHKIDQIVIRCLQERFWVWHFKLLEDIFYFKNILIQNSGWHVIGSSEQNVGVVSWRFWFEWIAIRGSVVQSLQWGVDVVIVSVARTWNKILSVKRNVNSLKIIRFCVLSRVSSTD